MLALCWILIAADEPQPKTISIVDTIDAADLVALFNGIDSQIPWPYLNKTLSYIETYSRPAGSVILDIKSNLKNAIVARTEIAQYVSEWCSSTVPLFKAHSELFTAYSVFKAETQHRLLQLELKTSFERMKLIKYKLVMISVHFNEIVRLFPSLFKEFEIDFNENSVYFHMLCKLNSKGAYAIGKKSARNKQIVADLKQKLAVITQFYINFNQMISNAAPMINEIMVVLTMQLEDVAGLIAASGKSNNFIPISPETIGASEKAAESFIAKCNEFAQSHWGEQAIKFHK